MQFCRDKGVEGDVLLFDFWIFPFIMIIVKFYIAEGVDFNN